MKEIGPNSAHIEKQSFFCGCCRMNVTLITLLQTKTYDEENPISVYMTFLLEFDLI
jgi:hypothetical protein